MVRGAKALRWWRTGRAAHSDGRPSAWPYYLSAEPLESRQLLSGNPVITELMASNQGLVRDGDGGSPDWVEIHNAGDETVDLAGYRLTDSRANLAKWEFPSFILQPGDYRVVFASGQDVDDYVDAAGHLHTNFKLNADGERIALVSPDGTIVSQYGFDDAGYPPQATNVSYGPAMGLNLLDAGSEVSYTVPLSDSAGTAWTQNGFDPAAHGFSAGYAAMGYESRPSDRTSFVGQFTTELPEGAHGVYLRGVFELNDADAITSLTLRLKYDNGFVAYLNGVKVAAENAPATLQWSSTAPDASRPDSASLQFVEFDLRPYLHALVDGSNVLAIHGLNNFTDRSDMLLVPELTAGTSDMQAATGVPAPVGYMAEPTPGGPNVSSERVFSGCVADTRFSIDRGFFETPQAVAITTQTPGADIYYTTDGSEPDPANSAASVYTAPLTISSTTTLRAAAFKDRFLPTNVDTQTYLFLEDVLGQPENLPGYPTWQLDVGRCCGTGSRRDTVPLHYGMDPEVVNHPAYRDTMVDAMQSIPTVSLVMDYEDLFGANKFYDEGSGTCECNADFERAVSVEIIDPQHPGEEVQVDAGIRPHSHVTLKRSFKLVFKSEYGDSKLRSSLLQNAPLGGDSAIDTFDRLILRAGLNRSFMNGWNPDDSTYTRDQWARDTQIAMSGYGSHGTFAHLYINGLYWGLYNAVERPDAFFSATYFGGDKEDYLAVNHGTSSNPSAPISGDSSRWDFLTGTLKNKDMRVLANYEELKEYLDVENFVDYVLLNWYAGTADWPQNNWYAGNRNAPESGPIRFYVWDAEDIFDDEGSSGSFDRSGGRGNDGAWVEPNFTADKNRNDGNARMDIPKVFNSAKRSPEFLMLLADRAYHHLFHGGALTEENSSERWQALNEFVRDAVIAESARWGDARENISGERGVIRTRDDQWQAEVDRVAEESIPGNVERMITALREEGYYPRIDPPTFSQHGGAVPTGFALSIANPGEEGTVYYTLDGSDPRRIGGDVAPEALAYNGTSLRLTADLVIRARVFHDGEWSALNEAAFIISNLRISEVNYYPHRANEVPGMGEADVDRDQFQFVEVVNVGTETLDLSDVDFARGIEFDFPRGMALGPQERTVVVKDRAAFESRYGAEINVAGEFARGQLSHDGDTIELRRGDGRVIGAVTYGQKGVWSERAHGAGSTLELIEPKGALDDPTNWRASSRFGGSPAAAGQAHVPSVVINEVLAHAEWPQVDMLELRNTRGVTMDISNWYISNSAEDYFQFQIPAATSIPAGGYFAVGEPELGFGFDDTHGDEVWLIEADANGRPVAFVDHVQLGPTAGGVSVGPWPDVNSPLLPLVEPTFGGKNSGPRVGDVVISEIQYHPDDRDGQRPLGPDDFEFIELYNVTDGVADLSGWQLTEGVDFLFPDGTTIEPHGTLVVVPFDPTVGTTGSIFGFSYGVASLPMIGPLPASLSDTAATIRLERPGELSAEAPESAPYLYVDEVRYGNESPWPSGATGTGNSLHRSTPGAFGNFSSSWIAMSATPGSVDWVSRRVGDANGDGVFNRLDIVLVLQGGKYLTGDVAGWTEGDWNGDQVFDQLDVVAALREGTYERAS